MMKKMTSLLLAVLLLSGLVLSVSANSVSYIADDAGLLYSDEIAALEEKIASLEQDIAGAATQYSRLTELMAEKEQAEAALEAKMDRWVYLNDLAEQIEAVKK